MIATQANTGSMQKACHYIRLAWRRHGVQQRCYRRAAQEGVGDAAGNAHAGPAARAGQVHLPKTKRVQMQEEMLLWYLMSELLNLWRIPISMLLTVFMALFICLQGVAVGMAWTGFRLFVLTEDYLASMNATSFNSPRDFAFLKDLL